jgi:hypothetical protein
MRYCDKCGKHEVTAYISDYAFPYICSECFYKKQTYAEMRTVALNKYRIPGEKRFTLETSCTK